MAAKKRWRQRLRREISEQATKARHSVSTASKMALRKTAIVYGEGGGVPRERDLTLDEEIDCLGYALVHIQEAENHFSQLRILLKQYLERLQHDHEIVVAHGGELIALDFSTKPKRKRPPRKEMSQAIAAAWAAYVDKAGEPITRGGYRVAYEVVGKSLNLSGETIRRYLRTKTNEVVG